MRFKLIVSLIFLTLVSIEASLHVVGFLVKKNNEVNDLSPKAERVIVLGESTSYGLMLTNRKEMNYPNLVQNMLRKKHSGKNIEVVNLSYPGQTSFSILEVLEDNLIKYRPKFAVLHFGVNDINAALNPISGLSFLANSKLFKLIYLSYLNYVFEDKIHKGDHGEFIFYDPNAVGYLSDEEYIKSAKLNYLKVLRLLNKFKIPSVMLNYYKSPKIVNDLLTTISNEKGIDLIDVRKDGVPKELFSGDNWHPNEKGHLKIADLILKYTSRKNIFSSHQKGR